MFSANRSPPCVAPRPRPRPALADPPAGHLARETFVSQRSLEQWWSQGDGASDTTTIKDASLRPGSLAAIKAISTSPN